jgi:hypothetical protein
VKSVILNFNSVFSLPIITVLIVDLSYLIQNGEIRTHLKWGEYHVVYLLNSQNFPYRYLFNFANIFSFIHFESSHSFMIEYSIFPSSTLMQLCSLARILKIALAWSVLLSVSAHNFELQVCNEKEAHLADSTVHWNHQCIV